MPRARPSPPRASPPAAAVAEEHPLADLPADLEAAWAALAAASAPGSGAFFASPQFLRSFAASFGADSSLSVLLVRDAAGVLIAACPLARARVRRGPTLNTRYLYRPGDAPLVAGAGRRGLFGFRQLSSPLGLEATALRTEIAALPGRRAEAMAAIARALPGLPGWTIGVLVLDAADADLLAGAGLDGVVAPLGRVFRSCSDVRSAEAAIAAQEKKFRQNMRRAEKFAGEAGIRFAVHEGPGGLDALRARIADLAGRSWKGTPDRGRARGESVLIAHTAAQQRFLADLAARPGIDTVLFTAERGDRLEAALVCQSCGPDLVAILLFVDADAGRLSLGWLLIHRAFDHAARTGFRLIDLNATSAWIDRYADTRSLRANFIFAAPTLRARALLGLARLALAGAARLQRPAPPPPAAPDP